MEGVMKFSEPMQIIQCKHRNKGGYCKFKQNKSRRQTMKFTWMCCARKITNKLVRQEENRKSYPEVTQRDDGKFNSFSSDIVKHNITSCHRNQPTILLVFIMISFAIPVSLTQRQPCFPSNVMDDFISTKIIQ